MGTNLVDHEGIILTWPKKGHIFDFFLTYHQNKNKLYLSYTSVIPKNVGTVLGFSIFFFILPTFQNFFQWARKNFVTQLLLMGVRGSQDYTPFLIEKMLKHVHSVSLLYDSEKLK